MSYNIRYDTQNDGANWWENRKQDVVQLISKHQPSIFGIQEGLSQQVKYLDHALEEYNYVGVGRDDGIVQGEFTAIYYDNTKFDVLRSETYWLSESPSKVSVGWDASMERIVTYAKFRAKASGDFIHVFNAHYDHIGELARMNSSKLIVELIETLGIQEERIAVIGDLNCQPHDQPIAVLEGLLIDAFKGSQTKPLGPIGTFSGFDVDASLDRRIDYVLTKNLVVKDYKNITERRKNNLWPSDHTPVLVTFK